MPEQSTVYFSIFHNQGGVFQMTTTATVSTGSAALTPGALKAQIARIRQGFDRPLPNS